MIEDGDYALAENSPCIESGENGVIWVHLDRLSSINFPPSEFSLISPENNYQLFIEQNNESQSLLFRWETSEDENEDNLYIISLLIMKIF